MVSPSLSLRIYDLATRAAYPLIIRHLKNRIVKGKEDPDRWREKLGQTNTIRPKGILIWIHAVGLGEVLALRAVIHALLRRHPDWNFLVTSGTKGSADVFSRNLPPRTVYQFAPVDVARPTGKFLNHWAPDLSIWAEQELWPGLIWRTSTAGIPLALINARMNASGFQKRRRVAGLYRDAIQRFSLWSAQDDETARNLAAFGAQSVRIDGSLKPYSPPLGVDEETLKKWRTAMENRFVWVLASSHAADEKIALAAHKILLENYPDAVLIIAPRDIVRAGDILSAATAQGLRTSQRSQSVVMGDNDQVFVADTLGELGLWYRIAQIALIGGTFCDVQGHNPWEALILGTPVLHGPNVANFQSDFGADRVAGAGQQIQGIADLAAALNVHNIANMKTAADRLMMTQENGLESLCKALESLVK